MKPFYVYILRCRGGAYYTGHTDDIIKRISQHKFSTFSCYTSKRLPIEVVFVQECASRYEAISAERKIKKWSRAKKEALIEKDWDKISELSKCKEKKCRS